MARNVVKAVSALTTIIIRHGPIITTNTPGSTKIGAEEGQKVGGFLKEMEIIIMDAIIVLE